MKILFLISSLGPGGAERVASTLCNAWVQRGDSVTLLPTFSGGGEPFYPLDERVELLYLANLVGAASGRNKKYFKRLLAIRRVIFERAPDVIVSFLPNVNVAALLANLGTGIPCIVCERSDPSVLPMARIWKLGCKALYRTAKLVTVQTEAVAKKIKEIYPCLPRVAVLANPLPEDVFLHVAEGRNSTRKILIAIGRLSEEKKVGAMIEAFAALAAQNLNWDFHIYGDGPLRSKIDMGIKNLALENRVFLKGRTSEPWRVMAEAHIFIIASEYEGFPNALLEAMGVGLPCIAVDCPSGPREITSNGIAGKLIPMNQPETLIQAVSELMSDESARLRLGKLAREYVKTHYSLATVLKEWDALFHDIGAVT
ncbi:glycosyltransferase family 4 protein [Variovorax paradoxus]|uniref:glycosyltransferase family 4 protein n=1 Tax=Variovorax paradoxus TaxID=34073 RepID=UPI0038CF6557